MTEYTYTDQDALEADLGIVWEDLSEGYAVVECSHCGDTCVDLARQAYPLCQECDNELTAWIADRAQLHRDLNASIRESAKGI